MIIISINYQYSFSYIVGVKTWATIIIQCSSVYKKEKKIGKKNISFYVTLYLQISTYIQNITMKENTIQKLTYP